ncbi:primosomal protein DnaI [Thalassorhabdus alkalitolerans]|uniref:Primosomal protein DnaI n=1 Tax=Thalassorhabdus alkalitolerans TaxID=2282697 RepID=A0ABW0YKT2_9BACI
MNSIRSALENMMKDQKWENRYDRLKQDVYQYSRVQEFLRKNEEIPEKELENNIGKLYEFKKEWENCDACPGLDHCPNLLTGYQPALFTERGKLEIRYNSCQLKQREDERKRLQKLIKSLYVPRDILDATFEQVEQDHDTRLTASNAALAFALNAQPGENGRGLYLYGKFGVGKTYLMGAVMNELAQRHIASMIVYVPDFFREMKQSVSDGTVQEKLDEVKRAPVLILDDIGAETMSGWVRDDILGVILHYRMMEKLPTLFTSNYDYEELEEHLAYSQKGGIEQLKAKRIMERIKPLTTPVFIEGKNRREYS